jgi:ferredoxin
MKSAQADFVAHTAKEGNMKVRIDYDLCMGDRNCNKVCPEVFEYDEDKLISRVLVDTVPTHLEEAVERAARECAPGAIIIEK